MISHKMVFVGKPKHVVGQLISFALSYGDWRVIDMLEDWDEANKDYDLGVVEHELQSFEHNTEGCTSNDQGSGYYGNWSRHKRTQLGLQRDQK
jgi:hypothetical protein